MDPLLFEPLIHRALWGGRQLQEVLDKPIGDLTDASESWEVCDLPGNQTIVSGGPHNGVTLGRLMQTHRQELLGRHADRDQFPLLVKFIDAQLQLSVQVHPGKPTRMPDGSLRLGKAESWIVIDTSPESVMFLGLREGVTEPQLRAAIDSGEFGDCLHSYRPSRGDCIYLQPGTVHALGGGLLIAEIQQPSDITYRLFDWGRVDAQGRPRQLHVEQGLEATNFSLGPTHPVIPKPLPDRQGSELLVECPHFVIHRHFGPGTWSIPDDGRMHVLVLLQGTAQQGSLRLEPGRTVVIPAARAPSEWDLSDDAILLESFLP